jgi:hypothetical protein
VCFDARRTHGPTAVGSPPLKPVRRLPHRGAAHAPPSTLSGPRDLPTLPAAPNTGIRDQPFYRPQTGQLARVTTSFAVGIVAGGPSAFRGWAARGGAAKQAREHFSSACCATVCSRAVAGPCRRSARAPGRAPANAALRDIRARRPRVPAPSSSLLPRLPTGTRCRCLTQANQRPRPQARWTAGAPPLQSGRPGHRTTFLAAARLGPARRRHRRRCGPSRAARRRNGRG